MDNKTYVFDPQQEIARLKQLINSLEKRIVDLESNKSVDVYGKATPIFGPENDKTYVSPWSDSYKGPNGYFNDPNRPFP